MPSSSPTPEPVSTTQALTDLAAAIVRTKALAEAIEAARGEYLDDDTGTSEDAAYNQAVSDVVAAIGALTEGGVGDE